MNSLREVLLLDLAQMVLELFPGQFLRGVIVVSLVGSHSTETALFLRTISSFRIARYNVPGQRDHFAVFVSVVLLNVLVVREMVKRGVVA